MQRMTTHRVSVEPNKKLCRSFPDKPRHPKQDNKKEDMKSVLLVSMEEGVIGTYH